MNLVKFLGHLIKSAEAGLRSRCLFVLCLFRSCRFVDFARKAWIVI